MWVSGQLDGALELDDVLRRQDLGAAVRQQQDLRRSCKPTKDRPIL